MKRTTTPRAPRSISLPWRKAYFVSVKPFFRWFDAYIGFYYDRHEKALYWLILPMLGVRIVLRRRRCAAFATYAQMCERTAMRGSPFCEHHEPTS